MRARRQPGRMSLAQARRQTGRQAGRRQMRRRSNWITKFLPAIRREQTDRGFIVVAVLWMMAMISALLLIYVNYVVNTGALAATVTQRVQSDALMREAVDL